MSLHPVETKPLGEHTLDQLCKLRAILIESQKNKIGVLEARLIAAQAREDSLRRIIRAWPWLAALGLSVGCLAGRGLS
jgi:hypothetical protein